MSDFLLFAHAKHNFLSSSLNDRKWHIGLAGRALDCLRRADSLSPYRRLPKNSVDNNYRYFYSYPYSTTMAMHLQSLNNTDNDAVDRWLGIVEEFYPFAHTEVK